MKHDCNHICVSETTVGQRYQYKEDDAIIDVELVSEGTDAEGMIFLNLKIINVLHGHFSGQDTHAGHIMNVSYNPEYAHVAYNGMWRLYPPGTYVTVDR